ncbi:MAG: hypothetical protein PHE09_11115 [Oscillospiraceae bacterium]|nr:hypothetical protein [Oscillospiraceae bacterium]
MNYRQIETSREVRLWITQVIVPAVGMAVGTVILVPEAKAMVARAIVTVKDKFKKNEA